MSPSRCEAVVEPSFLINLFATAQASRIIDARRLVLIVTSAVREETRRWCPSLDEFARTGRVVFREPGIGGAPYLVEAMLRSVTEGEAEAIALSLTQQVDLLVDDNLSIDIWRTITDRSASTGTTARGLCEILRRSEDILPKAELKEILTRLRREVRFVPPASDEEWWAQIMRT